MFIIVLLSVHHKIRWILSHCEFDSLIEFHGCINETVFNVYVRYNSAYGRNILLIIHQVLKFLKHTYLLSKTK